MTSPDGLQNHVFLSYAHADNEDGWVREFGSRLKTGLQRELGEAGVSVWRDDERAAGNRQLDDLLQEELKRSALLVAVASLAYLDSDWCIEELEFFEQAAREGEIGFEVAGGRHRLLRVAIEEVPKNAWPRGIRECIGYEFYRGSGRETEALAPDSVAFRSALRKLTHDAVDTLNALPGYQDRGKPRIFLAEAPPGLVDLRQRIESKLIQQGCRIQTDIPPPSEQQPHRDAVARELARSNLAIHVLGTDPGQPTEWDERLTYPQAQAELAFDRGKSIVLVPDTLEMDEIGDPEQRSFLTSLERMPGSQRLAFIRANRLTAPQLVAERLPKLGLTVGPPHDRRVVLLISHPADDDALLQKTEVNLLAQLEDDALPTTFEPLGEPEAPDRKLEVQRLQVRQSHGILAVWDGAAKPWVEERLKTAVELAVGGGRVPVLGLLVVERPDAPPRDTSFVGLRTPVYVIRVGDDGTVRDQEASRDFLGRIRG